MNPQADMDPVLRKFLNDQGHTDNIYIDTMMLIWNGICTFDDFKDFAMDNHNFFVFLEHVYMKLGPNPLGQKVATTERLLMLGHYLATERTTKADGSIGPTSILVIHDPSTGILQSEVFDGKAWRMHYMQKRQAFWQHFSKASVITFNLHGDHLHVVNHSHKHTRTLSTIRHDESHVLHTSACFNMDKNQNDALPSSCSHSGDSSELIA